MEKYRLLKDLPDVKKGRILYYDKFLQGFRIVRDNDDGKWVYSFSPEAMERNTEWFEKLL